MNAERTSRDLAAIRALMEESRAHVCGAGRHWVLWGLVGIVGLGVTYAVATRALDLPMDLSWVWGGLLVVGWVGSLWMGRGRGRAALVRNEMTRIVAAIWMGLGVTLTAIALGALVTDVLHVVALPGLLSVTVGAGYFATGSIRGLGWLRWLAGAWWVGGAAMLLLPGLHTLLVLAVMALALQIVPGVLLERGAGVPPSAPAEEAP